MQSSDTFEIFLAAPPGLEQALLAEVRRLGYAAAKSVPGGVAFDGGWPDVWRANLEIRGASRVLARIGSFRAFHLAQLDKRARKFPWGDVLPPGQAVKVEAVCRKSKIYHAGAASQRIAQAIADTLGPAEGEAEPLRLMVRIEDNLVTFSIDTSGELLHKRGHKEAVGKAPMRENLAALFLRQAGYDGQEPVLDPMCGSGTFVIEAAEIALGLQAGRSRRFAFERFATFDAGAFAGMRRSAPARETDLRFFGSDRNAGAVEMAAANAARAGVSGCASFQQLAAGSLERPDGPPGLVIVNPPYGARIGNKKLLYALHGTLGQVLQEKFSGWRAAIITSDSGLARATGLPFLPPGPPVPHGGLKVRLFQTEALG